MICLVGLGLLTLAAPKAPIAILPVAAEKVTLEAVPQLERLDEALRKGARSLPGIDLQEKARTEANLRSVREMDIKCDVEDTSCLSKIAVLTEVGRIIVPIARLDGTTYRLRVLIVNTSGGARRIERDVPADANDEALLIAARTLVDDLLRLLPADAAADPPPPLDPPPPPPPDVVPEPTPVAKGRTDPLFVAAAATTAAGALLVVAGGTGAILVDTTLGSPPYPAYSEREKLQTFGLVLLGATTLGVVTAGVGGVLFAFVP
jgi:hypothetical protein